MTETRFDRCFHFTGVQHARCDAGVDYMDVRTPGRGLVCLKTDVEECRATCPAYRPWTEEEKAADRAAMDRSMDLLRRGLSSCCEATINESRVIRSGRHKGHGPRYCSNCGKLAFIV